MKKKIVIPTILSLLTIASLSVYLNFRTVEVRSKGEVPSVSEIQRLQEENTRLRTALKAVSRAISTDSSEISEHEVVGSENGNMTINECEQMGGYVCNIQGVPWCCGQGNQGLEQIE